MPMNCLKCAVSFLAMLSLGLFAVRPNNSASFSRAAAAEPELDVNVHAVNEAFLRQYAETLHFSLGRPRSATVTPDGNAVLFLRSPPRSFMQSLYEFDCGSGKERVLLTAEKAIENGDESLPAEEQARRERQRIATRGI